MGIELLAILFFIIAVLYSSVGFGGGSSYLALLLVAGVALPDVRFIALCCNIIVVTGACIQYHRNKLIPYPLIIPLVVCSVPFAFLGGRFLLDAAIFKIVAGIALIMASLFMLLGNYSRSGERSLSRYVLGGIGSGIGFLSGLIGIGGGIFLSPVLHISLFKSPKHIAATTSFFILINSIGGILGQLSMTESSFSFGKYIPLFIAVLVGGFIGNYSAINVLSQKNLKLLTAFLIMIVGARLLYQSLV